MRQAGICIYPSGFGGVAVSTATVLAPVVDGQVEITEQLVVVVRKPDHHRFGDLPENDVSDISNMVRLRLTSRPRCL